MERGVSRGAAPSGRRAIELGPAGSSVKRIARRLRCFSNGRMTIRIREGGFRGVAAIGLPSDRRADAPLRAAGEGVFHEIHTAAVWPARFGSGGGTCPSRRPWRAGSPLHARIPGLSVALGAQRSARQNPITHQKELILASRVCIPTNPNSPLHTQRRQGRLGHRPCRRPVDDHGARAGQGDRHRHHAQ